MSLPNGDFWWRGPLLFRMNSTVWTGLVVAVAIVVGQSLDGTLAGSFSFLL